MKRFILAIILVLAFCVDSLALNLRPYMQTPPEVQVFAKRVIEDGGIVVDLEYTQKLTRHVKQLDTWSNVKFLGDANFGVKLNSGVSVQTLYDLSGGNHDAVQATVGDQPVWTANQQNGKYGLVFNVDIMIGSLGATFAQPNTHIVVVKQTGNSSKVRMVIDGNTAREAINQTGGTGFWTLYAGSNLFSANTTQTTSILTALFSGASSQLFLNGTSIASGNPGVAGIDAIVLGDYQGRGNDMIGFISFASVINATLTTAQRTAIERHLNSYYSIY